MTLTLTLTGEGAAAAEAPAAALLEALTGETPQVLRPGAAAEARRDLATALAIGGLVLAVPGAMLTTLDIAERLRKRRAAAPKVEALKRVLEVQGVEGVIRIEETEIRITGLSVDEALDRLLPGPGKG